MRLTLSLRDARTQEILLSQLGACKRNERMLEKAEELGTDGDLYREMHIEIVREFLCMLFVLCRNEG